MTDEELLGLLDLMEKHVNPKTNLFESIDIELARRIPHMSSSNFAKICQIVSEHNNECPEGYEIFFEYFFEES